MFQVDLIFTVPPHISPFDFTEESVNSGDTASVQCTVSKGDIPLEMVWYLNGEPAQNFAGITTNRIGKRISSLSIDSVDASHAGIYTCQAKNKAGTANYTADLAVNGRLVTSLVIFFACSRMNSISFMQNLSPKFHLKIQHCVF